MRGLKHCTRRLAITARFRRRISSSVLPENIGPQMTSRLPILLLVPLLPRLAEADRDLGVEALGRGARLDQRVAQAGDAVGDHPRPQAHGAALRLGRALELADRAGDVDVEELIVRQVEAADAG